MELCRVHGEFESEEMAELAAGRIRRNVRGIRRITVHPLGHAVPAARGRERFTMLPANLRMMNYATDVMYSDISKDTVPEPMRRKSTELLVICDALYSGNVSAIMQSMGAVRMRLT